MGLSEVFKKIFAGQKTRAGEAGQAVVEYILVLIVSVSIILGILYQFNDAFKNFLDSYFGDYIACLLETGELPGLGGDGPTSSECNSGFQNFSVASGRPPKESSAGGGGDSSDASSEGDGSSGGGDSSSGSSGGGRPARYNTAGNSPNGEAGFGLNNSNRPARQRLNTQDGADPEAAGTEGSDDSGGGSRRRRRRVIRRRSFQVDEEFLTRNERAKKKAKISITKKSKEQRRLAALRKAKFNITPPEGPMVAPDLRTEGFSFGKMLKFLIIAGIFIAIFIFLGGQALQIKKSWQKSE